VTELRKLVAGRSTVLVEVLVLGGAYYVAARLSLGLSLVEENITPLWPPTGIALVGFLLFGRRLWPAVAVAALAVNAPISASLWAAGVTAVGNTLAPLVAATLLRRTGFRLRLDRLRDALDLVFLGALLSTLISATIGAGTLVASGAIEREAFPAAWSVWWAGDAMGILVVAPFLLMLATLRFGTPAVGPRLAGTLEGVGLAVAVVSMSLVVSTSPLPIMFAVLPVLGWAAWRFQQRGAAPAALVVSLFATWAAAGERGPFAGLSLLDSMLTLQAFNAAVALTSLFLAALVTERLRARDALERAASDLEGRIDRRTAELSETNARLHGEVRERVAAEERLRASERRLADAQELAHLGSWGWDVRTGEVHWSDEMYRIYGMVPDERALTFELAVELVVPEDRARIQANVQRAIEGRNPQLPDIEYRIVRDDGVARSLHGKARLAFDADGSPTRMVGSVQDVTERRELEREHRIADTLQRALLPQRLPEFDGFVFASRYAPAEEGSSAGGDWFDVIELPDGTVALVIGDVAGHGAEAASVMGQVRMAVRAYSLEGIAPAAVVRLAHELLRSMYEAEQMVTMLYVVVDPARLRATIVNAGHPPPIVLGADSVMFLDVEAGLPIGLNWDLPRRESVVDLPAESTLVLFTDGLIDRRDVSVTEELERLRSQVEDHRHLDVDDLCGELLGTLVPADAPDDVAILAARLTPVDRTRLRIRIPADPAKLASVRRRVANWLSALEVVGEVADDIVLACSEACANSIEHAYGPGQEWIEIEGEVRADGEGSQVGVIVRDSGRWRPSRNGTRGRGLSLIDAYMDGSEITRSASGTELRMRRAIGREARA
jgi:PAS domain S-box-containing protein